jgi:biotin operon repressor
MRNRPVTGPEIERMRAMARDGASLMEIAEAVGRSNTAVRKHAGDLIPIRRVSQREIERIRAMARDGVRLTHIARAVKRSQAVIRKYADDLIPLGQRPVADLERILDLARAGRSVAFIAAEVECSEACVWRHTRAIRKQRRRARLERLLRDYERADPGQIHALATRFGYASAASLSVTVHHIRKQMRAEMREAA